MEGGLARCCGARRHTDNAVVGAILGVGGVGCRNGGGCDALVLARRIPPTLRRRNARRGHIVWPSLLGMRDDGDDVVCFIGDVKVEAVVSIHPALPYITGTTVFLRLDGWVPQIL